MALYNWVQGTITAVMKLKLYGNKLILNMKNVARITAIHH